MLAVLEMRLAAEEAAKKILAMSANADYLTLTQ
jgi:hypothetical protein